MLRGAWQMTDHSIVINIYMIRGVGVNVFIFRRRFDPRASAPSGWTLLATAVEMFPENDPSSPNLFFKDFDSFPESRITFLLKVLQLLYEEEH